MNVILQGNRIAIRFPFNLKLLDIVRQLPDRDWDKSIKETWSVPSTPWHCAEVIKTLTPLGFYIDSEVAKCADAKAAKPNFRKQLPKELFKYQKDGIEFIYAARGRALVTDDMGLGKSAEALVWANLWGGEKILIVAPANVTWKWAIKEIAMWAGDRSWQVIESSRQEWKDADITILSYAIMVNTYEKLATIPFDTMIFDEAHYLKSNKSQRNRVARKLVKGVPYLLLLTGTAFKNKRIEMFPLLNMIDPVAWSNVKDFGERYCGGKLQGGHWIIPPDKEINTEELQFRLSSIMLRRTKKQVANDLPDLTRVSIPITIDNATEYKQTLRSVKEQSRTEGYKPARALTLLNTLRQVVGMGKVAAAVELAEDILESGNQVVIHAHHKATIRSLIDGLLASGVPSKVIGLIDGSISGSHRQGLSQDFLDGDKRVMLVSSAGKEGIDLYSANHIIFVERQWTPADEEQLEARLHRQGQKNPVTAHYLVGRGTIDERLDEIVRTKRSEFSNLIETDIVREVWLSTFEE